jgi:hypothetical protein
MPHLIPGEWYISVVCAHCSHRILLFKDSSEGKSKLLGTRFRIMCPKCKKEGSFIGEHYQIPALSVSEC